MLTNAPTLAIWGVHTADNEPPKVHQVMNKISGNVASDIRAIEIRLHGSLFDPRGVRGWLAAKL